ncbi:thioredoxin-like domain-containing protein [Flavobacterium sp.]|jgi:thiol-disulfide isomerase/thioredoxin|uniref:thioredoxin-like domain-containing protein n=1 Tax=Flavobacterium sp. TaxID=239 RepID=UPI0037BEB736
MKRFFLAFVFCFSAIYAHSQSGYDITINLNNCNDTIAYLTFYQFDKTLIKDTCTTIKNGRIVFKGKNKLDKGIYSLVSQKKSIYFDFFIDDQTQIIELNNDLAKNDLEDLSAVNSPLENEFFNYIKFINKQNKEFQDYRTEINVKTKKDTLLLNEKQKVLDKRIQAYEKNFLEKNKATYIADVLNLKMEKVLQDIPKASNGRPDSLMVYKYYKKHYWDNIDFKEEATMRNPFFFPKLKKYFESVIVSYPDSVIVEVDRILEKTKPGSFLNKYMLAHLTYTYETSKIMGLDKVFVHISDKYFKTGKAAGIYDDESVINRIIKRADLLRPLLIGATAPDLSMIKAGDYPIVKKMGFEAAKTSDEATKVYYANEGTLNKMFNHLYSVNSDFIILVFWDVDCGHCQKEIPKLIKLYNELKKDKKDVKVYSVYTLHEGDKYLKYIADNNLQDWINVYDGAHINNVTVKYDVYSTPVIYVLDKNKKIKAKRIGVEQLNDIIKEMEKEYLNK